MKIKHDVFRVYGRWEIWNNIFLCLIVVSIFSVAINFFQEEFITEPILLSKGTQTIGTYIDRHSSSSTRGGTSYSLTYHYSVGGNTYTRRYTTNWETYSQFRIGDAVSILYLPDAPDISRTVRSTSQPTIDDLNMLLLFSLVGIVPLFFLVREMAFRLRGQWLDGEITHISGGWNEGRRHYTITVRYQFIEPVTGKVISNELQSVRNDLSGKSLPAVGTRLTVLYLNKYQYRVL